MRACENMALREIFGSNRKEVIGRWRILHSEEHHKAYPSSYLIKKDEMDGICSMHGDERSA